MGSSFHLRFISLLLAVAAIHGDEPEKVEFTVAHVANARGGKLFRAKIGDDDKVKELMSSITTEIWEPLLGQTVPVVEKVHRVNLFIDAQMTMESSFRALGKKAYEIHLSANHIEESKKFAHKEILTMLTYEMTHVLQNTANGDIPIALMDGIAAYVVIKLDRKPDRWVKYGAGDFWDQSRDVTGQFLCYCATKHTDFVKELNKKMEASYKKDYFYEISGKTFDQLWTDYKNNKQD